MMNKREMKWEKERKIEREEKGKGQGSKMIIREKYEVVK